MGIEEYGRLTWQAATGVDAFDAEEAAELGLGADRGGDVEELVGAARKSIDIGSPEHLVAENTRVLEGDDRLEDRVDVAGVQDLAHAPHLVDHGFREVELDLGGATDQVLELLPRRPGDHELEVGDVKDVAFEQHHVGVDGAAVDERTVGATQIADAEEATDLIDLGVLLRHRLGAQAEILGRVAADVERPREDRNARQPAALIDETFEIPHGLRAAVVNRVNWFQMRHGHLAGRGRPRRAYVNGTLEQVT